MSHQEVREYTLETAREITAVDEAADQPEELKEGTRSSGRKPKQRWIETR